MRGKTLGNGDPLVIPRMISNRERTFIACISPEADLIQSRTSFFDRKVILRRKELSYSHITKESKSRRARPSLSYCQDDSSIHSLPSQPLQNLICHRHRQEVHIFYTPQTRSRLDQYTETGSRKLLAHPSKVLCIGLHRVPPNNHLRRGHTHPPLSLQYRCTAYHVYRHRIEGPAVSSRSPQALLHTRGKRQVYSRKHASPDLSR